MVRLINQEFTVNISAEKAWEFLAKIDHWPEWAPHIKRIDVSPQGPACQSTKGTIHLGGGMKSTFVMSEFNPPINWKWVGPFASLTIHYGHQFEAIDPRTTRLRWTVDAEGFGKSTLGRFFAIVYKRNLSRAIPRLIQHMESLP